MALLIWSPATAVMAAVSSSEAPSLLPAAPQKETVQSPEPAPPVPERTVEPLKPAPEAKPAATPPKSWGRVVVSAVRLNIRAQRSSESDLRGEVQPSETVKVDFLRDNWYAIFPVTEEQRNEGRARGYIYAPYLRDLGPQPAAAPDKAVSSSEAPALLPTAPQKETVQSPEPAPPVPERTVEPLKPAPEAKPAATPPKSWGRETVQPAEPVPLIPEQKSPFVTLKEMAVRLDTPGKELFIIRSDRFSMPLLSGVEGENPQIVLEIPNTTELAQKWESIVPKGALIKKVQSHWNQQTRISRIVLDMEPTKKYFVKFLFFEKSNTYHLEITEDKSPAGKP